MKVSFKKPVVIAISGYLESGKDSLGDQIKAAFNQYLGRVPSAHLECLLHKNFSDSLKQQCAKLFGFPVNRCYTAEGKKSVVSHIGKTVRQLLTEYARASRHIWPDVWAYAWYDRVRYETDLILVTDLRYPNEVMYLDKLNKYHVHVHSDYMQAIRSQEMLFAEGEGTTATNRWFHESESHVEWLKGLAQLVVNNPRVPDWKEHLALEATKIVRHVMEQERATGNANAKY